MPNDNDEQRHERLRTSKAHIQKAREAANESRRLREASERLLAARARRGMR